MAGISLGLTRLRVALALPLPLAMTVAIAAATLLRTWLTTAAAHGDRLRLDAQIGFKARNGELLDRLTDQLFDVL